MFAARLEYSDRCALGVLRRCAPGAHSVKWTPTVRDRGGSARAAAAGARPRDCKLAPSSPLTRPTPSRFRFEETKSGALALEHS